MANRSKTITLWFSGVIPPALADDLRSLATVQERSFTILEADQADWRSSVDIVRRTSLWPTLLGVSVGQREEIDWRRPGTDIVGAVLEAADVQRPSNRPEDYEPRLPPPDMGFLPESVEVEVLDEPEVALSAVGEELVFSALLAQFLAPQCDGELGGVRHRGRPLPGFKRLFPRTRAAILSDLNRGREVPCRVCSAPLHPSLGIWIASEAPHFPKPVVLDMLGLDHLGAAHRIVVDPAVAGVVDAQFGDGVALEPIYSASSEAKRWVETVVRVVRA